MDIYRNAIASIESAGSGGYSAIGPTHPRLGRALGRYQVMESNIPQWSQAALGRTVTADEFLANPQIQDAIFDHQFGGYVEKFGPSGAAQAWFAGPGGVGKTNRKDSLGTSVGQYAEKFNRAIGGAPQDRPHPRPQGILSTNSPQTEAPMQDQRATGLFGALFPNMTADRQDRLAVALSGLSMNPNQGVVQMAGQRMGERREDRKEAKAQAKQAQQRNVTLEALRQAGVPEQDLVIAASNPDYMRALMGQVAQTRWAKPEQVKPIEVNGQLVNPQTGQVVGDYRDAPNAKPSEAEQEIARLMEIGMSRQDAIRVKEGVLRLESNPVTGDAILVDVQSGNVRTLGAQQQPSPSVQQVQQNESPDVGNVAGALGGRGIANSIVNSVLDAVGGNLPAPQAEQAASNLTNLSTQTMLALSGEWSGRPSNLTRERIEALTVKPNELFTGKNKALIRFKQMQELIGQAMIGADAVRSGNYTPAQRTEAAQKLQMLAPLYQEYAAIIQQLEGSGPGTGTTSSGIKWQVEQ